MLGWNESYNWNYEDYKNAINRAIKEDKKYMLLDIEHSNYFNEIQLIEWAEKDGYTAEIQGDSLFITIKGEDTWID